MDGYGKMNENLEEVKCVDGRTYKAKRISFLMDEKEIFAAEVVERNHPHHDWLISSRSDGVMNSIYMICKKCKLIVDITNSEYM
jgi:hypothetical protein